MKTNVIVQSIAVVQILVCFVGSRAEGERKSSYYTDDKCSEKTTAGEWTETFTKSGNIMKVESTSTECTRIYCSCGKVTYSFYKSKDCSGKADSVGEFDATQFANYVGGKCATWSKTTHSAIKDTTVMYEKLEKDVSAYSIGACSDSCQTYVGQRYSDEDCKTKEGDKTEAKMEKVGNDVCLKGKTDSTKIACDGKYTNYNTAICDGDVLDTGKLDKTGLANLMAGSCTTWNSTTHSALKDTSLKYTEKYESWPVKTECVSSSSSSSSTGGTGNSTANSSSTKASTSKSSFSQNFLGVLFVLLAAAGRM